MPLSLPNLALPLRRSTRSTKRGSLAESEEKSPKPASKKAKKVTKSQTNILLDAGDLEPRVSDAESSRALGKNAVKAKPASPSYANEDDTEDDTLKEGDTLPKINLKNEQGETINVSTLCSEKGAVLFLYPKADTPGCTQQACGFRDIYGDIIALDYDVYGLSKDSPAAQEKWKIKKNLNYHLLCDPQSKLIKRLGAFVPPKSTKRSHFIFEKGTGKLINIDIGVKPVEDPHKVLSFLTKRGNT
ncbi:uncharacterized protein L203_105540 [Cryptococcus depauperatus CBS 7841]|uniref:thioredoxin-dependent peroxiredoxin n=1 Tax=Cryptococcus depauperatus CBS 7841 TaxID=1295531 RepID=A0A1E3IDE2_9TREE|nr:hypothetical protein L203_04220 [Cryptococcus depauperatus CBS 7841]